MIRFRVVDIEDLEKWLEKLKVLRQEAQKRKELALIQREEERKKLERKVLVRRPKP